MPDHSDMMKNQNKENKEEWMKRFHNNWEEAKEI